MRDNCKNCGSSEKELGRKIISNGTSQLLERCKSCGQNFNGGAIYLSHAHVNGKIEDIPIFEDFRINNPMCEKCGALGTELHHWAPRAYFNDAEEWPKSYLCQKCHSLWHSVVTPKICEIKKEEKIFAKDLMLQRIQKHEKYDVLWLNLVKPKETLDTKQMLNLAEITDVFSKTEHGYFNLGWRVYAVIKESTGLFSRERMEYLFKPSDSDKQ